MTVKELIDILKRLPEEAIIVDADGYFLYEVCSEHGKTDDNDYVQVNFSETRPISKRNTIFIEDL